MTTYFQLLEDALVLPAHSNAPALNMGAGSTFVVPHKQSRKELTEVIPGERLICYRDERGLSYFGWLRKGTKYQSSRADRGVYFVPPEPGPIKNAWDDLREKIFYHRLPLLTFVALKYEEYSTEFKNVVRELGGRINRKDDDFTVARQFVRLVLNQEVTMSDLENAVDNAVTERPRRGAKKSSAKKGAKKGKAAKTERIVKKAPKAESEGRIPATVNLGTALQPLVKGTKIAAMAKSLAAGDTPKKKDMENLRDSINELAVKAREAEDFDRALELSSLNRIVRRIYRSL